MKDKIYCFKLCVHFSHLFTVLRDKEAPVCDKDLLLMTGSLLSTIFIKVDFLLL